MVNWTKKILIIMLIICMCLLLYRPVLCVYVEREDREAQDITFNLLQVNNKDEVRLSYNMSIYNVPQTEVYRINDRDLQLVKVKFGSYPAALYYNPEKIYTYYEGFWILEDPHYTTKTINIIMGYKANYNLETKGGTYYIADMGAKFGDKLKIEIKSVPYWKVLKGKLFLIKSLAKAPIF